MLLRDRNANADGTLEERLYYMQNWRAEVVLIADADGSLEERVDYSAYGEAILERTADFDGNGEVDGADASVFGAADPSTVGDAKYNWKADFNNDGQIDGADFGDFGVQFDATRDRRELSPGAVGNTRGYAGYARDTALSLEHVRHRVYRSDLGRWTRRDPAGYVDGGSLYNYISSRGISGVDPSGLRCVRCSPPSCGGRAPGAPSAGYGSSLGDHYN